MAKQMGILKVTGRLDNICFYKMGGEYYARTKSSLCGQRVKKDPAFSKTMQYAGLLAQASKISAGWYRSLEAGKKEKGLYRKTVGQVMNWLKTGKTTHEIMRLLEGRPPATPAKKYEPAKPEKMDFAADLLNRIFYSPPVEVKNIARTIREAPA